METKWNLLKQIQDQLLRQASWRITIKGMAKPMVLVGICHCPPSEINWHSTQEFINDFLDFYVELGAKFTNIIFLGDFNIHVLDIESIGGEQFTDICDALGLQQHVTQPTHSTRSYFGSCNY